MVYPRLEFDFFRNSQLADNIWNAQMAGHEQLLTYSGPDILVRRQTRRDAMHFEYQGGYYEIPHIFSRDEYPFACTREGGGRSWVGHIPPAENSSQGGLIAGFLVRNGIRPGMRFLVVVTNHPKGPVTAPVNP